jgi:8-oxo-dGTP pyrophosphatase MutT (NUDIX family)
MFDNTAWKFYLAIITALGSFLTLYRYWSFIREFFSKRKIADMDKKISWEAKKGYNDLREAYAKLSCPNGIDRESPRSTLLGLSSGRPLLEGRGFLDVSEDIAASSKKIADTLRSNEEMGFLDLDEPIEWRALPLRIPYYQSHFSTFLAAIEAGLTLSPITAGALICCSETKEVVYMRRSKKVHTFPGHYHHFGGGFKASTDLERFDADDLFETAQREIREETGCRIDEEHFQAASMLLEGGTGYFQYLFLGVDISKEQRQRMKHSGEGVLVDFKFDELGKALASEPFVPTCILQTMIWLMLGAPTSSNKKFSAKSARRQYKFLMEHFGMA